MATRCYVYEVLNRDAVSDDTLLHAATLFSENYGVWTKGDRRVTLSARRLGLQYMPDGCDCSYVKVTVEGRLAGHAFACRWECEGQDVCWVTQLVVHRDFRRRGLATGLLTALRNEGGEIFGILSSHPAACLAAAKAFKGSITQVELDFIKSAGPIMSASPIDYVKNAQLKGSLFATTMAMSGLIAGVDTQFYLDYGEPLRALQEMKRIGTWPLGDLPEGHEYLLVLPAVRKDR